MAQSIIEAALANIDSQIADLQRARDIIVASHVSADTDAPKAKRGRKKKQPGLPSASNTAQASTTNN